MPNLNRVYLMGNLTRDPELRFTPNGSSVSTLSVAVNRVYTNRSGERKEEVCYVNVQVWGKQAESCTQYLRKGKPVFVEGRLRNRSIDVGDGKNRTILEVVATRVQFLSRITEEEQPLPEEKTEEKNITEGLEEVEGE